MSREKQNEEMAQCLCGWNRGTLCILDDKDCNLQCTYGKLANELTAKGYRKSTDLAEEIFAEIDEIFERQIYESRWLDQNGKVLGVVDVFYAFECWRDYIKPELKKKYTESEKDDEQR